MGNVKNYTAGQKIIAEGSLGGETYLIRQGRVGIRKELGQGGFTTLATLGPDEVFGEMYLFNYAGFRSASAFAESDVELEVIAREEIEQFMNEAHPILKAIIKSLNNRLESTTESYSLLKYKTSKFPWNIFFGK